MSKWRDLNQMQARGEAHCGLPGGFFRVNYFHGKEMRLADYVDEQRYHAGKMRFHNDRLHGSGILCGLRLSVMEPEGTLLRVGRGAALDACGREVIVGFDQCVDVAAWFRQQAYAFSDQDDNPCKPDATNRVRLCVVMRYAECGGAPEPVPADPCGPPSGCGDSTCGCGTDPCGQKAAYGRTTEEFELRLMFADAAEELTRQSLFPTKAVIADTIAQSGGATGLLAALAPAIRACCPRPDGEWLNLGCFHVLLTREHPDEVKAIEDIDYACASQVLLSTEVIQYLLAGVISEVDPDIGGPDVTQISFRKLDDKRHQFALHLSGPIDPTTLDPETSFGLRRLASGGWQRPGGAAVAANYSAKIAGEANYDSPTIYISVETADFLVKDGRYQLFAEAGDPVVDSLLRRLRPRHFSWRFTLQQPAPGDDLSMQPLGA